MDTLSLEARGPLMVSPQYVLFGIGTRLKAQKFLETLGQALRGDLEKPAAPAAEKPAESAQDAPEAPGGTDVAEKPADAREAPPAAAVRPKPTQGLLFGLEDM